MTRRIWLAQVSLALVFSGGELAVAAEKATSPATITRAISQSQDGVARRVELFQAMEDGVVDVKFIAKSDRAARLIIHNKTKEQLDVELPEAFAGIPAVAQFGGGGGGRGGGGGGFGGGGGGRSGGGGGGSQGTGGGFGGGGGGQGGGGGGGFFSVPPEQTGKINTAIVCLDHGLRDPSSSKPYKIVPVDQYVDRPAVVEMLKAFGRGDTQHGATQAAVWHLNNDLGWQELAAKRQGTRRSFNRPAYFSREEMNAAVVYASEAIRRAAASEDHPADHGDSSAYYDQ